MLDREKLTKSLPKRRNHALIDRWSFVHFVISAALTIIFSPAAALLITLAWEPVEILIMSPLLAKAGIDFGHESLKNSLSDVAFNLLGVLFAIFLIGG